MPGFLFYLEFYTIKEFGIKKVMIKNVLIL